VDFSLSLITIITVCMTISNIALKDKEKVKRSSVNVFRSCYVVKVIRNINAYIIILSYNIIKCKQVWFCGTSAVVWLKTL